MPDHNNKIKPLPGSTEKGVMPDLLTALNAAAVYLQQVSQSAEGVLSAFSQQLEQLRVCGTLYLLTSDQKSFSVRATSWTSESVKALEVQSGLRLQDVSFPVDQIAIFRQIIADREPVYVPEIRDILPQFILPDFEPYRELILESFEGAAVFAPIQMNGNILGIFSIQAEGITPGDIPAVKAFSNHIAVALENARLFSALREAEEQYHRLFEAANDGIVIMEPDSMCILSANPKFAEISGYTLQELLGMPDTILFSKPIPAEDVNIKGAATFEVTMIRKDGQQRAVQIAESKYEFNGRLVLEGVVRDIQDRKEIEEALMRRAEEYEALHTISLVIAEARELPLMLSTIVEQAVRLTKGSGGTLYLCSREQQIVRSVVSYPDDQEYVGIELPFGEGAAGLVAQTGQAVLLDDYATWPGRAQITENLRPFHAVISAPIVWKGEVSGVVQVRHQKENRKFTQSDLKQLTLLANQAAVAIENSRLIEAERSRVAELEGIRQASLSVTGSLELRQVLDSILSETITLLPDITNGQIFLFEPEQGTQLVFAAALWAEGVENQRWNTPHPHDLAFMVARQGEIIVIPDATAHPLYRETGGTGAAVGLPLTIGPRVVGVMNILYQQPRQFSGAELRIIGLLGDQAAIAIENARLFEQAETERRHLGLLYEIARVLNATQDSKEILDRAITITTEALDGHLGHAFLYQPELDRFKLAALYGHEDTTLIAHDAEIDLQPGVGLASWAALNRQPYFSPDVTTDEHWRPIPGVDSSMRSALVAPILRGDDLLGVMSILHAQPNAFSTDHLALLQAICQEVGLALDNAARYQDTRRRLAETTLIQSLAQKFNQRLNVQALLNEVAEALYNRLHYPQVEIFLLTGGILHLRVHHGHTPRIRQLSIEKGIMGRAARSGQPVLVKDIRQDPDFIGDTDLIIAELAVPILREGEVRGIINIQTDRSDGLGVQDQELLQILADQVGVALENAVLYERQRSQALELQQMVEQRTAELAEIYALSQEIAYSLSFEEMLRSLLIHLHLGMQSEIVIGSIFTTSGRSFSIRTNRPLSEPVLELIQQRIRQAISEYQDSGQSEIAWEFEVIRSETYDETQMPIDELAQWIHAPILIDNRIRGLLIASCESPGDFTEDQKRLMITFTNQAVAAIQRISTIRAAQQQHLESLFEHLPIGMLLFDAQFNLLVANASGREYLILLNGALPSGPLSQLGPYPIDKMAASYTIVLPREVQSTGTSKRHLDIQISPVESALGESGQHWVLSIQDVTQEREIQIRTQGQERLATVGQLAAGIAHDFNNIMAAILVYTDLLIQDNGLSKSSRNKLEIIQQQIQRAASLIRQILDFSRRSVMEQSALDLLPFIKELDKLLARVLPETIRLNLEYQKGSYWVNADPTRLQQVFMNLALNARDAMPDGGSLKFSLDRIQFEGAGVTPFPSMRPGEWIRIRVSDTGVGISPEIQSHIFEPFFTTKPVGQGTGLGLAQVYGIIKQHDGYIDVQSQPGNGATFIIYLPLLEIPTQVSSKQDEPHKIAGNGETILVVEDDPVTREAMQALLEAHNYRVISAANGVEALDQYERSAQNIALVVCDLVMPEMGGLALYQTLHDRWPNARLMFVTGHPLDGKSQKMLEKGGVHWLQKPFSIRDFNQVVHSLLKDRDEEPARLDSPEDKLSSR